MRKISVILLALTIGAGALAFAFAFSFFIVFAGYVTPQHSRDGQGGLPEFVRLYDSMLIAAGSGVIATGVALWRLWPRQSKTL